MPYNWGASGRGEVRCGGSEDVTSFSKGYTESRLIRLSMPGTAFATIWDVTSQSFGSMARMSLIAVGRSLRSELNRIVRFFITCTDKASEGWHAPPPVRVSQDRSKNSTKFGAFPVCPLAEIK